MGQLADADSPGNDVTRLTAIFQDDLGKPISECLLAGFYWSSKTCKAPVISSPPTNPHPAIFRPDALLRSIWTSLVITTDTIVY